MRRLGNTLYILSDDLFLTVDGMNVVAKRSGKEVGRIPLHTLSSIYSFSYMGASPALMGKCAEEELVSHSLPREESSWLIFPVCKGATCCFDMRKVS